ncbi:SDR family NAD(P)-dependent oxidoreductase [Amycolatopsis sp. YIM 10]|uniref:SDR family NAD(P)-dependent oxidoreductase n=1 Tax=Amycolatopsis sp. YIM 10 TaxID=2653857 RepID=UPI0012900590|nr:SDR family NAD(P)-dependent oxidoreductase [Amycolatopsis sp. YIM 10]QFU92526.1 Short-chain reductase protein NovJ [Amycolatopsis sp. YIM 10]
MFDLSGHTAIVTGAGQNAGAGIARALAAQGAAVVVNDLVAERADAVSSEIRDAGGTAIPMAFDVTELSSVRDAVDKARSEFGRHLDILVHNAGIPADFGHGQFRTLDPSRWRAPVEINLFGAMNLVSAVIGEMCDAGWGRIVQISSGSARVGSDQGLSLYGASKSGVEGFIRHISQEVGPFGVTANTLALGLQANAAGSNPEVFSRIATRRPGTPEDVGAAVVYLASPEASWMTGQTLNLNGGSVTT